MTDLNLAYGTCSDGGSTAGWEFGANPTYPASNANDGSPATYALAPNNVGTGTILRKLKTDLGAARLVSGMTVIYPNAYDYMQTLEYSADGSSWSASGVTPNAPYTDVGAGGIIQVWPFAGDITARYWRLVNTVVRGSLGYVERITLGTWQIDAGTPPPPPPPKVTLSVGGVEIERPSEIRCRVELNAAGSGYLRIAKSDAQATEAILTRGATCAVTIPEIHADPIFEFLLQDGDFELVSSEEGAEELAFSGPGTLSYLARAVLDYVEYEDGLGTVKLSKGVWVFAEGSQEGHIINKMIKEAQSASRPSDPIPLVTKTFSSTLDSNGEDWGMQVLDGKWREKIGANLLTAILRLVRAGLLSIEMAPGFVLNCYRAVGVDRSGSAFGTGVVRFAKGVNIAAELSRSMAGVSFATHGIVRYGDGSYTRAVKDGGLPYDQEAYFESNSDTGSTARRQAKGQMKLREDAQESLIFSHTTPWPGAGSDEASGTYLPGPAWSDNGLYWVGDLVTLHTGTADWEYDNATKRVYAITLGTDATGYLAPPIVELNAPYRRKDSTGETGSVTGGSGDITITGGSGSGITEAVVPRWKDPVRCVVTTPVTISTALNAGDSAGGVTLVAGDRVLVTAQASALQNGIYQAGTTPSRTSDFDAGDEVPGAMVVVLEGTGAGQLWRCTSATEPAIDTDAIDWAPFTSADAHLADTVDAHDASAISIVDAGTYFTATDVEGALQELGAGGGGASLAALSDVDTTGVADGDVLTYDTGASLWVPAAPTTGGAITVKDEGTTLTTALTSLDFAGAGVSATNTGGAVTISVSGGGGTSDVLELPVQGSPPSPVTGKALIFAGYIGGGTLIPTMTSNTTPSGVASASSNFSSYPPYRAFAAAAADYGWLTNGGATGWLRYQFATGKTAGSYKMMPWPSGESARRAKSWTLEGSNDGSSWTTLDTQTNHTWVGDGVWDTFTIASPASYTYYRVSVSANYGDSYMGIGRLQLVESATIVGLFGMASDGRTVQLV